MIIKGTSNYKNALAGNLVSITGDGGNAWGFYGNSYKKLAPKLVTYTPYSEELKKLKNELLSIADYMILRYQIEEEYIKSYYDLRLKNLDIDLLYEELYQLYGENIILLCHEPSYEFCHRRLVADYIELKTGINIPEVKIDIYNNVDKITPIDYKERLLKYM